ncbi:MAG: hypothetical protein ACYC5Q_13705 [Thermoleophilia bacterium]
MTGGRMAPEAALAFVKGAVNGERELRIAGKATRGRRRLNLDTYDQDEVLLALERHHFGSWKPAKRPERIGFHYNWLIPWRVPTEDGRGERDCLIYVKFRIPPDETFVELTSFKEDGDEWL